MFLSDDPLGDRLEMFKIVWTVKDAERCRRRCCRRRDGERCRSIRRGSATARIRRRRARTCCLDRPMPESAEGLTLADDAAHARPSPAVRAADRPRGAAGSDGRGGRRSAGRQRDGARSGRRGRRAGTETRDDRPLVGHSKAAAGRLAAAARRLARSAPHDDDGVHPRRDSQSLAGVEAGRSRRALAARSGRRRRRCRTRAAGGDSGDRTLGGTAARRHRLQRVADEARSADARADRCRHDSRLAMLPVDAAVAGRASKGFPTTT